MDQTFVFSSDKSLHLYRPKVIKAMALQNAPIGIELAYLFSIFVLNIVYSNSLYIFKFLSSFKFLDSVLFSFLVNSSGILSDLSPKG